MPHIYLVCATCAETAPASVATLQCPRCAAPLDVGYASEARRPAERVQLPGMWGRGAPLPVHDAKNIVSLGEGNTPVVALERLGARLNVASLVAKLEFQSPTASFKDRGAAMLVSVLRESGIHAVVEDSSGNAGAALAAYAARAGIVAHIFAPTSASAAKLSQIAVYGGQVHLIDGPREAATSAAVAFAEERGLVYASHSLSPFYVEGTKTFAYEAAAQLGGSLPRHVVFPVGNGSLLIGAWKGFLELRTSGAINEIPRLHAVQAEAVRPVVAAFHGQEWTRQPGAGTVAGGIAVGEPPRLRQMVDVLRQSGGTAVAVGEAEILEWQRRLAREEGIYAEPTSAAALAGVAALVKSGVIGGRESVLVPLTGSGLKDAPPG